MCQMESAFSEQHTQYCQVWCSLVLEMETTGSPGSTPWPLAQVLSSLPRCSRGAVPGEATGDRAAWACLTFLLWLQQLLITPARTCCLVVAAR